MLILFLYRVQHDLFSYPFPKVGVDAEKRGGLQTWELLIGARSIIAPAWEPGVLSQILPDPSVLQRTTRVRTGCVPALPATKFASRSSTVGLKAVSVTE